MLPDWVVWFILLGTLATLVFQGIPIYLALQMPRIDPGGNPGPDHPPRVSIVVAARNEALDLPACLDSLLGQTYPDLEIVVVDGGSTDGTADVARARGPRVRLIEEPPLPPGWVGKNWGCRTGAAAAAGEYILFMDADVHCHPDAVRATVAWALAEQADLATLAPRIEMRGFWERLILPFYTQVVLTYFRAPRVNRPRSRTAMANGQFLLVRRGAYDAVGGHEGVRGYVLEDVRLAQNFRARGFRLRVGWAPELLVTRMYRHLPEMFEGLLKNVHGTEFSPFRQLAFLALLVGFYWLPLSVLPIGWAFGSAIVTALGALLLMALFGKHAAFARATRGSALYGLLFPVAVGFYVVLVGTSLVRGLRGSPIRWKGRSYALETASSAKKG
ncbi:MAG TPA: glycosyltransferase family 2 protein [Thermoplasmata archaeon]|nr:glycosyltransferase family 2 protein [Thermoplasmata archaeon]